jgi:hypothetical protein
MRIDKPVTPPIIGKNPTKARWLRLLVVRAAILALAIAAVVLYRHPLQVDNCLQIAAGNDHALMVRYYLLRGDDVNQRGLCGYSPLMGGVCNGNLAVVDLLVRHGAKLDITDDQGNTALMWAAGHGREDVVAYLIGKGAFVDQQDLRGNTAIMYAMQNGYVPIVHRLTEAGANLSLSNQNGETVMMKADQRGYSALVAQLKHRGAVMDASGVGLSPYPVAHLTPPQLWALATTALLVQYNGDSHEILGSKPASCRIWAQSMLKDGWGVATREEAIGVLDWLKDTGHRQRYQAEDRFRHQKQQSSPSPYLAWDYCRLVWVAGVSYVAGHLTEAEAWQRIMPAARAMQANYSSWREMGEDYLRGRKRWNSKRDPRFDRVFQLLANANDSNSPWTKNKWNTDLSE